MMASSSAADAATMEEGLAVMRGRIHKAIGGDVTVVAGCMATWGNLDAPASADGRVVMPCPIPGHEDSGRSCTVFTTAKYPAVWFRCSACGSAGDIITIHQLIFGSDVRQAMRAVWTALAGTLWEHGPSADPKSADSPLQMTVIIDGAATACGVPTEMILGPSRQQRYVEARQLAMLVARTTTDLSYPEIGRALGGRDHTTVIHGVRRMGQLVEERNELREKQQMIEAWAQGTHLGAEE